MTRRSTLHRSTARLAALGLLVASATGGVVIAGSSAAVAAAGAVGGTVFEDFNSGGTLSAGSTAAGSATATDVGIAGAAIKVTDSTGATVGTGTSAAGGTFTINVTTAATTAVRVEVTPPAGFTTGPHGTSATAVASGSDLQFVTLGTAAATTLGFAEVRLGDYSPRNPDILTVQQAAAIGRPNGALGLNDQTIAPTLVTYSQGTRGTADGTTRATASQTGAIWGLAQLGATWAFTSAYFKRHSSTGPGGLGAIYLTDATSAAPNAAVLATIPNAGTNPRGDESTIVAASTTAPDWFHDVAAYRSVGKVGLGGLAIAPDRSALYVVNLNNRSLYEVPLGGGATPTAGTPVAISLPLGLPGATACANASVRPFGVAAAQGALFVTLTCTGPTAADLRAYVYRMNLATNAFSLVVDQALSGYARGSAYTGNGGLSATWNAWDTDATFPAGTAFPQPEASDVAFDANGDMSLAIKDRFGDQVGYKLGDTTQSSPTTTDYEGFPAGDTLRLCLVSGAYVQESAGACGSRTGFSTNNNQGPGGGEFYFDDFGSSHNQTSLGALLQLPGFGELINTSFDPSTTVRTEGIRFMSNANGTRTDSHTLIQQITNNGSGPQYSFGKAGGLGDMAALVDSAPFEIGNRVWGDDNANGVQDAGEAGIAGVTVDLYAANGTTLLGTVVTAADGTYWFSNAVGTDAANAKYGLPLVAGSTYVVKLDHAADFTGAGPLVNKGLSPTAVGTDRAVDSNGAAVSGTDQATVVTDPLSVTDHTIDFGFTPPLYAVGDFVWSDTNANGRQDAGEPGVLGAKAHLVDTGTGAQAKHLDGTTIADVTTDAAGHYVFDAVPAGTYTVTFTLPTGDVFTTQDSSVATDTNDSDANVATGQTAPFTLGPIGSGSMAAIVAGDGTTVASAIDRTRDAGIVPGPSVSVGDFVWNDVDHDGVQGSGEAGIPGVQLTITKPGGGAVNDIFDVAVGAATTDANGNYLFSNLPLLSAGQSYTVHLDNSQAALAGAGFIPTLTGQGTTATDSSNATAVSSTTLTTGGASDLTLDFGFFKPSVSVGDFVWHDTNHNGVQDSGEAGINGVTVTLTGPGGGAVTDIFGAAVGPTTTAGNGAYLFDHLPVLSAGQSYTVHVSPTDPVIVGLGYAPTTTGAGTTATDSSTATVASASLTTNGASDLTLDFGFVTPSVSVGDLVFSDSNHDGIQNTFDPGIGGVTVTLTGPGGGAVTDVNGALVGPATTAVGTGKYLFSNLPVLAAGQSYTVHIDSSQANLAGAGYSPTITGAGTTATDSSTTSADSVTTLTTDGASDLTLDFGFFQPVVRVGNFVWHDVNHNGIQDAGEPGINGVTVTLTGPGGVTVKHVDGTTVVPVLTAGNGAYVFNSLPPLPAGSHYTVHVDPTQSAITSLGYIPTLTGQGTTATDSSTGSADSTDLTVTGAVDNTLDFGFVAPSVSVGDFVWKDTDRDGIQDAGEPGIPNVKVTITAPGNVAVTDVNGNVVGPATTDGSGNYVFTNLPTLAAGQRYTVRIDNTQVALAGVVSTLAGQGADTSVDSSTATAPSVTTLTTDGASDLTLDFGFVVPAVSVGDFVWHDENHNGVQDGGEPGIDGVTVTITKPGGGAVTDVNGTLVPPQLTVSGGTYLFTLLPVLPAGQSYTVHVDPHQAAITGLGFIPTTAGVGAPDTDSSTGTADSVTTLTTNNASDLDLDFGFVAPSVSVGDLVFYDTDHNGIQGPADTAISGVTVTLTGPGGGAVTDINGNTVAPATTDSSGIYLFTDLPVLTAGQHYTAHVDDSQPALAGFEPAKTGQGTTATDSSDGSAESSDLTTDGDSDTTLDFGFIKPAVSVGDFVWHDLDHNGVQDVGEPGIDGVTVTLTGPGGAAVTHTDGTPVTPTLTAGGGAYSFTDLPPLVAGESYTVHVSATDPGIVAAGYVPTTTGAGTAATDSSTDTADSGDLSAEGDADLTLDFGFATPEVSVGDFVWDDLNHDGVQDSGEPGIPGVQLTITAPGGVAVTDVNGALVGPATTDATGAYVFSHLPVLPAGDHYTVHLDGAQAVLTAPGFVPTKTGQGTTATDSSTDSATSGDLVTDQASDDSLDFGFIQPGVSVGDFVWLDLDRNGVQDIGEPGLEGVQLTITGPGGVAVKHPDGTAVVPVTTDANGAYVFTNLPALPAGESYTVHLDGTQTVLTDAGLTPTLVGAGSTATDSSDGTAASGDVTTDGDVDDTLDFGFVPPQVSVGDFVWNDVNRNGVQDAGEPGLAGVVVTIVDPDGNPVVHTDGTPVLPATTGATGAYLFSDLPVLAKGASYTVSIAPVQPALVGYAPTLPGVGADRGADSSTGSASSGDLVADGDSDLTLDFGFVHGIVSVGDKVFKDLNHNGLQDAGEPGIAGVVVTITGPGGAPVTDVFGTPVGPQTTDAVHGTYLFDGLPSLPVGQTYTVHLDGGQAVLAPFQPTRQAVGTDPAIDSSTGSATSGPLTTDGASDLTLDFGFVSPVVSVGDFIWKDVNRNGVQDAGEPGIPGVVLTLTGPTGVTIATAVTDANGAYLFTGLPALLAGQVYTVHVDNTQTPLNGLIPTIPGKGTTATDSSVSTATTTGLTLDGQSDLTLDFGFVPPAVTVGDQVFKDPNGNGIQDKGDPGIAGVTVTITGPDGKPVIDVFGKPVPPQKTDPVHGTYLFTGLPALPPGQSYTVKVTTPRGFKPTLKNQGGNRCKDSSTGFALSGNLTVDGASNLCLDFGFVKTGSTTAVKGSHDVKPPKGTLSFTGGPIIQWLIVAAGFLSLGWLLILVSRRRRVRPSLG